MKYPKFSNTKSVLHKRKLQYNYQSQVLQLAKQEHNGTYGKHDYVLDQRGMNITEQGQNT